MNKCIIEPSSIKRNSIRINQNRRSKSCTIFIITIKMKKSQSSTIVLSDLYTADHVIDKIGAPNITCGKVIAVAAIRELIINVGIIILGDIVAIFILDRFTSRIQDGDIVYVVNNVMGAVINIDRIVIVIIVVGVVCVIISIADIIVCGLVIGGIIEGAVGCVDCAVMVGAAGIDRVIVSGTAVIIGGVVVFGDGGGVGMRSLIRQPIRTIIAQTQISPFEGYTNPLIITTCPIFRTHINNLVLTPRDRGTRNLNP